VALGLSAATGIAAAINQFTIALRSRSTPAASTHFSQCFRGLSSQRSSKLLALNKLANLRLHPTSAVRI
jgi:hypothetical protein